MEVRVKRTRIFDENHKAETRYVFNPGGSRSSKTFSLLQLFFYLASIDEKMNIYSVVSETMPHLRRGAMRDFLLFLRSNNIYNDKWHNKSDNIYQVNKSIIEFFSADSSDKVHGPERDFLFVNELNNLEYDTFFHLAQRTRKRIYADWNPVSEFWVYEQFINNDQYNNDLTVVHSTIYDNPYVSEHILKDVERRAARDDNYRRVYLMGEIGVTEGVIFKNWRYEDDNEIKNAFMSFPVGYGLDYGFNPDPDAMCKVAIDQRRKIIYCDEKIYQQNNSTGDLIRQIQEFYAPGEKIVAESASPRTNYDLQKYFNLISVSKTRTVAEWLRFMQDYDIVITKESVNLARELRNYTWSDKKSGTPIDGWNHICDAVRYYLMDSNQRNYF